MDLNKVQIIGRLTRDPEIRSTPNGAKVASVGIATNFTWTDQSGQKKEQVEFHNIVMWRGLAGIAEQYLKKGSQVYIEGRLQTRSWEGTDGKKNYRTEIIAENMIMLGRPSSQSASGNQRADSSAGAQSKAEQPAPQEEATIQLEDSDIPF